MLYDMLSIFFGVLYNIWSFQIFGKNVGTTDFHAVNVFFIKLINFNVDVA